MFGRGIGVRFVRRAASCYLPVLIAAIFATVFQARSAEAGSCPGTTTSGSLSGNGTIGTCAAGALISTNGFEINFSPVGTFTIRHRIFGGFTNGTPSCTGFGCGASSAGAGGCNPGFSCDFTYQYTDGSAQSVTVLFDIDLVGAVTASVSGSTFDNPQLQPQTITFNQPPDQVFGTTPTLSASANSMLPVTFSSSTMGVCTISGGGTLAFNTTGSCTINADQAGDGTYVAASQVSRTFTVTAGSIVAPTITSTVGGNGQATISFTAGSSGGATVTNYEATSSPGGITATSMSSPITVTGLSNGTPYTFTVRALTSGGPQTASAASGSVTPSSGLLSQTILFHVPQRVGSQTTSLTINASASSNLPVTYSISGPSSSICSVLGNVVTFALQGECIILANQAGDSMFAAAPEVRRTVRRGDHALNNSPQTQQTKTASSRVIAGTTSNSIISVASGRSISIQRFTKSQSNVGIQGPGSPGATFFGEGSGAAFGFAGTPGAGAPARIGFGAALAGHFTGGQANLDGDPFHYASAFEARNGRDAGDERFGGTAFAVNGPMRLSGDLSNGSRLNFAASLSQATQYVDQVKAASALSPGEVATNMRTTPNPFDVWIEGKFTDLKVQGSDGRFGTVGIGADYLFTPKFLAGLMIQFDDTELENDQTESGGRGWLAGPYAAVRLDQNIIVHGRFGWGEADKSLTMGGVTDKFGSTRWLASGTISGAWAQGPWTFSPSATIAYMQDTTEGYTDIVGNVMPELRFGTGQDWPVRK